jgi:hypothetical protein
VLADYDVDGNARALGALFGDEDFSAPALTRVRPVLA